MLTRLLIENYALIDHLDIAFPGELVIITGETGAGKSILLGALSLALGGRSDTGVLHDPSRNCVVEAEFEKDGETYVIRRVVTPQGRSRGFVNDEPASVEQLRALGTQLVDIHSQNQQLLLAERSFQLSVLDSFAGLQEEGAAFAKLYRESQAADAALAALDSRIAEAAREQEYLSFRHGQLVEAGLREGELEELEEEQRQLANSESIKEQLALAGRLFEESELSLDARLKEIGTSVSRVRTWVSGMDAMADRIESARIELKDIRDELAERAEKVVYDPARLEVVDSRLARLYDLLHKFGQDNVAGLMAERDALAERLGAGENDRQEREELLKRRDALRKDCLEAAARLHERRVEAAPRLSKRLTTDVRTLEMPRAELTVTVRPLPEPGPDGADDVDFLFDANGAGARPLAKCASGGELSRIMLCIKALLAQYGSMPTLVFDEIDTGVSGSVADKMGRLIVEMGGRMQVFAITHLPQVASKGSAHYLVYKENGPEGASTHIRRIEGDDRLREVARMLSGAGITPEALANAAVLLQENRNNKQL